MAKLLLSVLLLGVVATLGVRSASVSDCLKAIRMAGNRIRLEALSQLQQEQVMALATALGLGQRVCILRESTPGYGEIHGEVQKQVAELTREVLTAPPPEDTPLEEYRANVTERIRTPVFFILENRLTAIRSCA